MGKRYDIAIKSPVRRLFTYESETELEPGSRVRLPFRNSERVGIVWGPSQSDFPDPKSVIESLDDKALFDAKALEFYEFAAQYYGLPLGELLSASVPKKIRDGQSCAEAIPKSFQPSLVPLTIAQQEVVQKIEAQPGYSAHLLFGETGSGKTEVYLHLMERYLREGGQVLFLVPEISLTPQLEDRLTKRVGTSISSFHSHLTEKKRWQSFSQAYHAEGDLFLGARSALFLPYRNLKLIIVDEEHDPSYKQSERLLYHARDLALLRAKLLGIPIVLGSATPSVESYRLSEEGRLQLHRLPRYQPPPERNIELIDLKKEWKEGPKNFISSTLHEAIEDCLDRGEQSLLFLNRRGSATHRACVSCGATEDCPHCSLQLTLHYDLHQAICHMCEFRKSISERCETCGDEEFFVGGIGTKEIEVQVRERFPEARIARLDRDVTARKAALPETIEAFAKGEIDILIGTQMISKGIDIEKLSLVGVILADQGWSIPDFRAMERSYQVLHQILGRAGRRGQASRFIIQALKTDHPLFDFLKEERTEDFLKEELKVREMAELPPWSRAILWTLSHKDSKKLFEAADVMKKRLEAPAERLGIQLMGPVPAPLERAKGEYRVQIFAKSRSPQVLTPFLQAALDDMENRSLGVKIRTERDPYQFW